MQNNGTSVYFVITATDNNSETEQSSENTYTVNNLPEISNVIVNPENPTDKNSVQISATISDSDGTISFANLKWGTESESYTNTISMTNSGDDYSGEIPAQSAGATVYFLIEAIDNLTEKNEYNSNFTIEESTGIIDFSNNNLKIYPNPAKEILNIELSENKNIGIIKLYNVVGEKVYEVSGINSSETSINLHSLSKGVYFIQILNTNDKLTKKIIIE